MTTEEREQLQGLARQWREEAEAVLACGPDSFAHGIMDCTEALESLLSGIGDGWIPVGKTWPPPETTVLLCTEKGEVVPGYWDAADAESTWYEVGYGHVWGVTHWQRLPKGPEGR